ncbi:hypothetical protein HER39_12750 [Arthrobacter deserti]|uniref:DUF4064 domain-containing protein n=1 Tax=Arthrobacter deserti TaxID=1742687 RepID=A0ABX1JQR7_9MICC|nr:hypothetical protein [Arthrobacter deserti]
MSTPENTPSEPGNGQPQGPAPGRGQQPPQYGQNLPQYGQQAPQYGQQAPQYGQQAPQYGQQAPQYGQQAPQYGQNLPQYGQQYGYQKPMPGQYGYPGGQQQYGSSRPSPPREVMIAFWLFIAAAVLCAVDILLSLSQVGPATTAILNDPQLQDALSESGGGLDPGAVRGAVGVMVVIFGLVTLGLYLLVAFGVRAGKNWARILGTVFAALSLFGLAQLGLGTLVILLGVAAIGLLFLPVSSAYFKGVSARRSGYYGG